MFGTIMSDKYDEPVLLNKTAWGGKESALIEDIIC